MHSVLGEHLRLRDDVAERVYTTDSTGKRGSGRGRARAGHEEDRGGRRTSVHVPEAHSQRAPTASQSAIAIEQSLLHFPHKFNAFGSNDASYTRKEKGHRGERSESKH